MNANQFPPTSRYYGIETRIVDIAPGRAIVYLARRFVPQPEQFSLLQIHRVTDGDRLDNITARYLDDPEQFWRLCDANRALRPAELELVGSELRITLPEGVPGIPRDA